MKPLGLALIAMIALAWITPAAPAAELSGDANQRLAMDLAFSNVSVEDQLASIDATTGHSVQPSDLIPWIDAPRPDGKSLAISEPSRADNFRTTVTTRPGRDLLDDQVVLVFASRVADRQPVALYVLLVSAVGCVFVALEYRQGGRARRRSARPAIKLLNLPQWSQATTPRSIAVFGLQMPCTEEQLKEAYRARVKVLHPDHGGDARRFVALQSNFEDALRLVLRVRPRQPQFAYSQAA